MQDLIDAHFADCTAAMEQQNEAFDKAQAAFLAAVEAATDAYGEKIQQSRQRLWDAMQERFRVWNGEPTKPLPQTGPLTVRSPEEDPTGMSA